MANDGRGSSAARSAPTPYAIRRDARGLATSGAARLAVTRAASPPLSSMGSWTPPAGLSHGKGKKFEFLRKTQFKQNEHHHSIRNDSPESLLVAFCLFSNYKGEIMNFFI